MSWLPRFSRGLALGLFALLVAPLSAKAVGVLVPTDRGIAPLAIRYHRVNVEMVNGTAVTKIEQVFHNHTPRPLEATFYFPMPEEAAIIEFAMWMNGKKVLGEVLDRGRALAIYEEIVRRMRDPGLIEWAGQSLFKARIFPVPANGDQKIEISYTQVLPYEDGVYRYVYPLKTTQAAARTLEDFTIQGTLESRTPIRNVYSPTHRIYVRKRDEHHATVGFEQEGALLQKDFELMYTVSKKDIGLNLLTYRPEGEPGYFLLMASPKATYDEAEIVGKSVIFVIDTSGSMAEADKMDRAKKALRYCVERLNPRDQFNIIRFSSDVEAFRDGLVSAREERRAALEFIEQLEPAGGTAIHDAMLEALKAESEGERPIIVFITDGRPTVGQTETEKIVEAVREANGHRARVFTFGVGSTVNTKLLDELAAQHGGVATYVQPDAEMETTITSFYNKMSHPVLSDLSIEFRGVRAFAMLPGEVPDLFRGDQLLILGRYRNDGDALVRLVGKVGGEERTYDYEGTFPEKSEQHAFIAQLWANRQVGYLLEQIRLHGETPERVEEAKQLALRYGIVTPYTSYLVTEPSGRVTRGPLAPPATAIRRREGTVRGVDRGSVGGGAPAAEAPAPSFYARSGSERRRVLVSDEDFEEESGAAAVDTSRAIRDLKEEDVTTPTDTSVRYIGGKVFRWSGGWVDQAYTAGMPTLEVKYLSEAYFRIVREIPALKAWLSLGEQVTIVVNGTALVISSSGKEALTDAELGRLE